MQSPSYTVGQVIFIRSDTPDYAEESVPFKTLEEMAALCSRPVPDRILEKIVVYSMIDNEPVALTFGFVAASRGQRPQNPDMVND